MKGSQILIIVAGLFLVLIIGKIIWSNGYALKENNEKISPDLLKGVTKGQTVKVEIFLKKDVTKDQFNQITNLFSGKVHERFYPESFVAELTSDEIRNLNQNSKVDYIYPAFEYHTTLQDSVVIVGSDRTNNFSVNGANLDGNGQTVAIADSGIDFTHPDLAGKNALGGLLELDCYTTECTVDANVTDLYGHGTHVAGIVSASGGITGIAPGVKVIALKILPGNSSSGAITTPIARAINWATNHSEEYNISVVSISLTTGTLFSFVCDPFAPANLVNAINNATAANISVVASTGNNGNQNGMGAPGCIRNTVAVGATNKSDARANFSNYDVQVKLFAPGVMINSTKMGGGYLIQNGTSMSAPMVSGSIAVMNQLRALAGQPRLSPKLEAEATLFNTGDPIINGPTFARKINLLNAVRALDVFPPAVNITEIKQYNMTVIQVTCGAFDLMNNLSQIKLVVINSSQSLVREDIHPLVDPSVKKTFFIDNLPPMSYILRCEASDIRNNTGSASLPYKVSIPDQVNNSTRP